MLTAENRFVKLIGAFLLVTGTISLTVLWSASVYYAARAPGVPHPEYGAVYPFRIHQSIVYLTRRETYFANGWLMAIATTSYVIVIVPEVIKRWRSGVWRDLPADQHGRDDY
jgi:hypothetical protein